MSTPTTQEIVALLGDVINLLTGIHACRVANEHVGDGSCLYCSLTERARQLVATLEHDPDRALFDQIEAAGASDVVSNTVDHLENMLMVTDPFLKVDPKAMLRAVILTAQQRLDWGYGPIGGVRDNVAKATQGQVADVSVTNDADDVFDEEFGEALDAAAVAVEIEAESLIALRPQLDKERAIQLVIKHVRENGWCR